MSIFLHQVYRATVPFQKLIQCPFGHKTSYLVHKYIRKFDPEQQIVEAERQRLITLYGKKDDKGISIDPESEAFGEFMVAFNKFLSGETDLKPIPVTLDQVMDDIIAESEKQDEARKKGTMPPAAKEIPRFEPIEFLFLEPFFETPPESVEVPSAPEKPELKLVPPEEVSDAVIGSQPS